MKSLFDHLKRGRSLDYFLEQFPTVPRDLAIAVIDMAGATVAPPPTTGRQIA